tara:strand:+ start:582 stop:1034 length:453 start_codon:yes stop_codon:yes gene_type:complete
MIRAIILILILSLFSSSCGFAPIYSNTSENLNINLISASGDNDINLGIKSKLRTHKNLSSQLIEIKLETAYTKQDLSKNDSGEVQNYQLNAISKFYIDKNNDQKIIEIRESFTMENINDDFEEQNYEKEIKENFSFSIYQKLIMQLIKIQ